MSQNIDFISALGGAVEICPPGATFLSLPGAETMIRYRVKASDSERGGESLWNLLARNVEARKIRIHRQTAVTRLVRSDDEIVGVEADREGRPFKIRASRAVVLATGGFEYNEEMKREYLAGYPSTPMAIRVTPATGLSSRRMWAPICGT